MVIEDMRAALARIEAEVVALDDARTPEREFEAFAEGLRVLFYAVGGVPDFFDAMLNRLIQPLPSNAYPHTDHAFLRGAEGERDPKGYMERMRRLVPVALMLVLKAMNMTKAQSSLVVAKAMTEAGYRWPSDRRAAAILLDWYKNDGRADAKADKAEQFDRAKRIVLTEHAIICQTEKQAMAQRAALIERVAYLVTCY